MNADLADCRRLQGDFLSTTFFDSRPYDLISSFFASVKIRLICVHPRSITSDGWSVTSILWRFCFSWCWKTPFVGLGAGSIE